MFHFVCVCSFLAFTPFLLLLHYLVLLYILACVYPLWHERYVGFWAHVFFLLSHPRLGIVPAKAHALFFMVMGLLAINLVILLHCVCYSFCLSFISYYPVGLLADVPAVLAHWSINSLLRASLAHLPHLYLSLLLWAYLPSFLPCQPIEFTTLFLEFPQPIYFFFFFTSHYSHELTISFLEYLWPIYFFFTSCYCHGLVGYQSYHFSPLGLFPNFFTVLPLVFFSFSLLLGFFYCWALCQKWHQHNLYHKTK